MEKNRKINYFISLILIVAIYLFFFFIIEGGIVSRYQTGILILVCINIILATSLNVTVGCLGQITLGHAGFMAIGGYAAALLTKSGFLNGTSGYIIALIIGGLLAGIVGVVIGIPALRLNGDYLAIINLAFGEIIRVLIEYFSFTGGAQGLNGIKRFNNFSLIYWIMILCFVIMYSFMLTRHGRAIRAIREDEIAAGASGINTTYYKTLAFSFSAIFAGIAGGIYAHNIGVLSAKQFDYNFSINILVMVVLGGMGSFTGATISAIVLTILPEFLRTFAEYRMIVYPLILIIMMIFRPRGLLGHKEFKISKVIKKIQQKYRGGKYANR